MNKKDVMELRKRFKKDCSISRMAGCYVDSNKHKVVTLNENFLNLGEDEFFRFLEIAKKTMGGTIGNNILELDFPTEEEEMGGRQQFLMGLRASNLENEDLLDRLYDQIIEHYDYVGNYLILVYHDSYDIMTRTSDNNKLDESEEVYEYLLISICPVELSKPGLGYRVDENRIGARVRDWVVGAPDVGILFPAFSDRSADIHKADYFVKDAKDPHADFVEELLGVGAKRTATQQRKTFHTIVKNAFGTDTETAQEKLLDIQENISMRLTSDDSDEDDDVSRGPLTAPIVMTKEVISDVLKETEVSEEVSEKITKVYEEEFADELPSAENLVDSKMLKAGENEREKRQLVKEVANLKRKLSDALGEGEFTPDIVSLSLTDEKADRVTTRIIDDQKYVMIPVSEEDELRINGVMTNL